MSKITVKNISSATVVLSAPDIRFSRSMAPGRVVPITDEIYDELMADGGVQNLLRAGYIRFDGVAEEAKVIDDAPEALDKAEVEKMIADRDVTAFAKFIPHATPAEKETVIQYVVANNVTDNAFAALIKKYCGVDVIQAITIEHQSRVD